MARNEDLLTHRIYVHQIINIDHCLHMEKKNGENNGMIMFS